MARLFGGGSKPSAGPAPKKPKPSAHEKELGRQSMERHDRYMNRYAPLEDDMVAGINRPTERLIQGRSNADVMREATMASTSAIESGGITQGLTALNSVNQALSRAGSDITSASITGDRALRDDRAMGAIEVGLGMSERQTTGLSELGHMENQRALSRFNADNHLNRARAGADFTKSSARTGAVMGVLGTAAGAATQHKQMSNQQKRIDAMFRAPALDDFRSYGR